MASEFNAANYYKRLREDGQLTGIRCNVCGFISPEARPMCPACRSFDLSWHAFSGRATLSTFTCISVVPDYWGQKGYGRNTPIAPASLPLRRVLASAPTSQVWMAQTHSPSGPEWN